MSNLTRQLRHAVLGTDGAGLTDGQLLGCFVDHREEAAFTALLHRHGPMVCSVCRRVLRSQQDVEDAFQATFLVLLRKAPSIKPREMVASWLFGVAHQTARNARAAAIRRGAREKQVLDMPEPATQQKDLWHDLQPLLDQELSRLPHQYRILIVLCDLEGKTRKKVAQQLGCPEGTVAGRLARARAMLARRLARHGLAVSGVTLATVLSDQVASASVPISVMTWTEKAVALVVAGQAAGAVSTKVAALAEGVMKTMLLTKLKIATAVLVAIGVLVTGIGFSLHPAQAGGQTDDLDQSLLAEPVAKAPSATIKVQIRLEELSLRNTSRFVTGTFVVGNPEGDGADAARPLSLVRSKLMDIPVSANAKIKIGGKDAKFTDLPPLPRSVTLELAVEERGLVVVGIQTIEKQEQKAKGPVRTSQKDEELRIMALEQTKTLFDRCATFRKNTGDWPSSLQQLREGVPLAKTGVQLWVKIDNLLDPWGRSYIYQLPGTHNNLGEPDIYSLGSNPKDKNGVIGSWMPAKPNRIGGGMGGIGGTGMRMPGMGGMGGINGISGGIYGVLGISGGIGGISGGISGIGGGINGISGGALGIPGGISGGIGGISGGIGGIGGIQGGISGGISDLVRPKPSVPQNKQVDMP